MQIRQNEVELYMSWALITMLGNPIPSVDGATLSKANKRNKGAKMRRNKCGKVKAFYTKRMIGKPEFDVRDDQDDFDVEDQDLILDEARKTWDLGKSMGLYVLRMRMRSLRLLQTVSFRSMMTKKEVKLLGKRARKTKSKKELLGSERYFTI